MTSYYKIGVKFNRLRKQYLKLVNYSKTISVNKYYCNALMIIRLDFKAKYTKTLTLNESNNLLCNLFPSVLIEMYFDIN